MLIAYIIVPDELCKLKRLNTRKSRGCNCVKLFYLDTLNFSTYFNKGGIFMPYGYYNLPGYNPPGYGFANPPGYNPPGYGYYCPNCGGYHYYPGHGCPWCGYGAAFLGGLLLGGLFF
jgi:hypothetical protein